MELLPSAHVDTFCRDRLPPADQWPEFLFDPPVPEYPGRLNCATALLDGTIAQYGGDRPCLHAKGSPTWTYDDLTAAANRIAHVLVEERGLVPGNRVLLRGPNAPWLVACWFAVLKAGGVVVATMPMLRTHELQVINDIAAPDLALVDHRFLDAMHGVDVPVVAFGGDSDDDLTRRAATRPADFSDVLTSADDVALLAFTSGTTGRPKCAMHFHRDVLVMADTFSAQVLGPTPDDVFTGTPPIAFTVGAADRKGVAGRTGHPHRGVRRHHALHRSDRVQGDARRGRAAALAEVRGVGGRAPARGDLGGVPRGHRRPHHRRHRVDRDAAHLRGLLR
jgi:2-aminobenzoate-CoA ligase